MFRSLATFLVLTWLAVSANPALCSEAGSEDGDAARGNEAVVRLSLPYPVIYGLQGYWLVQAEYEVPQGPYSGIVFGSGVLASGGSLAEYSNLQMMFGYTFYPFRSAPHGWFIGLNGAVQDVHVTHTYDYGSWLEAYRIYSLALRAGYEFLLWSRLVVRPQLGIQYWSDRSFHQDIDLKIGWSGSGSGRIDDQTTEKRHKTRREKRDPDDLGPMAGDRVKLLLGLTAGLMQVSVATEGGETRFTAGDAAFGGGGYTGFLIRAGYPISIGLGAHAQGLAGDPFFALGPELLVMVHPATWNIGLLIGTGPVFAGTVALPANNVRLGVSLGRHLITGAWAIGINGGGSGGSIGYAYVF